MVEIEEQMLKKLIITFTTFLIFAFTLITFYDIIAESTLNALTGNIVWDSLLVIIPIAFSAGVIMILYNKYVPQHKGD